MGIAAAISTLSGAINSNTTAAAFHSYCSKTTSYMRVNVCLQGVCSDSASFDLPAVVLAACVQEVQSALEIALVRQEDGTAHKGSEIFVAGAGTQLSLSLHCCMDVCNIVAAL